MNPSTITPEQVRTFLLTRFAVQINGRGMSPDDIPDSFDFLLEGVVDSLGILEMVSAIEKEFGIELDLAGLDVEQVTLLGPLSGFVAAQVGGVAGGQDTLSASR